MYEVAAGLDLARLELPADVRVVLIPETSAANAALKGDKVKIFKKIARQGYRRTRLRGQNPAAAVTSKAYEPDARATAILRGVTYAQQDLAASGGAYDVAQVRALLHGVSRQAVDKRVADGSLLAVPGPSGRRRFPTVQFNSDGSVVSGLKDVSAALGFSSSWSVLNFLTNGNDLLGGRAPIELLRKGDVGAVVEAARRTGVQGA